MSINSIPNVLLKEIFSYFKPEQHKILCLVSKLWNKCASQDVVWMPHLKSIYGEIKENMSIKECYKISIIDYKKNPILRILDIELNNIDINKCYNIKISEQVFKRRTKKIFKRIL